MPYTVEQGNDKGSEICTVVAECATLSYVIDLGHGLISPSLWQPELTPSTFADDLLRSHVPGDVP